ncbi:MAG TPA: peptide deformylase [Dehalococcoidia bacterium]|nr:peptide deformylase [Dehalococcoidia bacterium]
MIYDVIQAGDDRLRRVSEPVDPNDLPTLQQFIDDLDETRRVNRGIGIAAPQVGVLKRIISIEVPGGYRIGYGEVPDQPVTVVVNPILVWESDDQIKAPEGCLSIRGYEGFITRAAAVRVEGLSRSGEPVTYQTDRLFARALLHEIDHLNGILFIDHLRAHQDLRKVSPVEVDDPIWGLIQPR